MRLLVILGVLVLAERVPGGSQWLERYHSPEAVIRMVSELAEEGE